MTEALKTTKPIGIFTLFLKAGLEYHTGKTNVRDHDVGLLYKLMETAWDAAFGYAKYHAAYDRLSSHDKAKDEGKTLQDQIGKNVAVLKDAQAGINYSIAQIIKLDPRVKPVTIDLAAHFGITL